MKLMLKVLELKNFKGIKQFRLMLDKTEVKVYGANAAGKTTLVDAFMWLLFDKDSQDKKDFEIKTLEADNTPIHFLDHEVTGDFEIDGRTFTLSKRLKEKWVKKRGQAEQEFSGHETTYYIDGVPCKKTEYQKYVDEIIGEKTFKLLTNPLAFENMKWQEKRRILFEVCGNIEDHQVEGYEKLQATLGNNSVDDFKKSLAATKKKLKTDIDNIPPRIDELERGLEDNLDSLDLLHEQLNYKLESKADLECELEATQGQFQYIRSKQQQILSLERTREEIKREHDRATYAEYNKNKANLEGLKQQLNTNSIEQDRLVKKLETLNQDNIILNNKVLSCRKEWQKIAEETFDEHKAICPTCGQSLPGEQLEELKAKYLGEKLIRQKRLVNESKIIKAEIEGINKTIVIDTERFEVLASDQVSIQNNINQLEEVLAQPLETTPCDTAEIDAQIEMLKKEVQAFASIDNEAIKKAIHEEEANIQLIHLRISKHENNAKTLARIDELKEQLKDLQCKLADTEQQEILVEDFTKAKVEMLEENINSHFKTVKFKLFDQQINGGLTECCESLINGVPFSGANTASQVAAGIDIINVLSNHYNAYAPIFIDGRESVTDIPSTQSQVINLIVSAVDKELRVE